MINSTSKDQIMATTSAATATVFQFEDSVERSDLPPKVARRVSDMGVCSPMLLDGNAFIPDFMF